MNKKLFRSPDLLAASFLFATAFWILHRESGECRGHEIVGDVSAILFAHLLSAFILTILSYFLLAAAQGLLQHKENFNPEWKPGYPACLRVLAVFYARI